MNLPEIQQIQDENKQFYKELTNLTGMVISTPNDVNSLYGTLTAEVCRKNYYLTLFYM